MAQDFKAPESLVFSGNANLSDDYRKWQQKFDYYLLASGKSEKDGNVKVAVFLTCIGDEGIDIFNNFTWENEEDQHDISIVCGKFKEYCEPRKNTVIERYKFWNLHQNDMSADDMSTDEFVNELKTKSKNCDFREQRDLHDT